MKMKKTFIITFLLLGLLMIGAASAANDNTTVGSDVNDDTGDVLAQNDAKAVSDNDDESILNEDYSETSFKALNKTINEATDLEIELDKDYTFDEISDSEFKDGIVINKSLTIDGKGKTINADGKSKIFNIQSGATVIIKNLNFINGNSNKGGLIYVDNGNLTITNSNMTDNKAGEFGGAIYINNAGTVMVDNVIFTNNYAENRGGAIQNYGQLTVINSLFEKNSARIDSGAIRNYKQLTVIKSIFKGNKAETEGAAISNWYGIINITECVFENNEVDGRGGAVYSNTADNQGPQYTNHLSYSNFTNNTARGTLYDGGAIYFTNNLNATGNIFTNNHAGGKETIYILDDENVIFENNTYVSTDMYITGLTLNLKDDRTSFNATEDIILIYDIALKYSYYYKDIQTGLRGITLYVDGENRTTLYENITLKDLKPGPHTAYFTVLDYKSNNITFYVFNETEISTAEASYDYAEGTNTKIPLLINDKSDLAGTISVTVKDQDGYKPLSFYYNVRDRYTISTATLADALENTYGTLDSSYTINITYSSEYGYPSSTEFTLNINDKRSTRITYNIINNTEGNVQINITVENALTGTPIQDAIIQITGDITKDTVSGIITDNTLTAGDHTITVAFPETESYRASQATINFNVEIDKDKKIKELEEELKAQTENLNAQIQELQNKLQSNQTALEEAQKQIVALNEQIKDLQSNLGNNQTALQEAQEKIQELQNNLESNKTALQKAQEQIQELQKELENNPTELQEAQEQIQELQKNLESNQTALKQALEQIQELQKNLESNQTALQEAQSQISVLNKQINTLNKQITTLKNQQKKVSPKVTKIVAKKKTFKAKVKVKKYTIKLKAGKKAVPKVKVYLTIKGKKYKKTIRATTNAKGKAIFKIKKLTKKGKYKAKIKFKGNTDYKASKKAVKIIIK